MSVSNAEFYQHDQSSVGVKLHAIFEKIVEFLEKSVPVIQQIESFAGQYEIKYFSFISCGWLKLTS